MYVIYLFPLLLVKLTISTQDLHKYEKLLTFTSDIIDQHFSDCSLFFIDGKSTSNFMNTIDESYSPGFLHTIALYSFDFMSVSASNTTFLRNSDIRFSSHCSIVVTRISEFNNDFQKRFMDVLISDHNEMSRKDEDHYIFISESESIEKEFLLSPLSLLIRFKLVIRWKDNKVIGHTLCFYCGDEGSTKIMAVDLRNNQMSLLFHDFTRQFNGHIVRLSANTGVPAIYVTEKVENQWRNKRGLHVELFFIIMHLFNFTYTTRPSTGSGKYPAGGSGLKLPNGTFIGCVGDILSRKADLAMNVSPNTQRMEVVTFSSALAYVSIYFITAKPKTIHSWQTIFKAFDLGAWAGIGAVSVFTGAIILFFDKFRQKFKPTTYSKRWTIKEAVFSLYGSFVGQSAPHPSSAAGKINFVFWLYFTLIVSVAYVSKLTSFIMLPGSEIIPKTFKELTNENFHFKWGASAGFRGGLGEMVFKYSSNPSMRKIYHSMKLQSDDANCAKNCLISKQACIVWDRVAEYTIKVNFSSSDGSHPFSSAKDSTYFVPNNWVTRKREIFLPNFNQIIMYARDSGLSERLMQQDWAKQRAIKVQWEKETDVTKDSNSHQHKKGPKPFTMANVKGCFYLLLAGLLCSAIYFMAELAKIVLNSVPDGGQQFY